MSSADSARMGSDLIFEILSSHRRRMVLYYLRTHDGTTTMDDLAEHIAAWENDIPIEDLSSQQRKRVYVSLYQTHLPKLADSSLIDYDASDGIIQLTDRATEMDAFLSSKETRAYPWRRYYLGLLAIGATIMLLSVFLSPVIGQTMVFLLAGVILAGYVVTIAVEFWIHRKRRSEVPAELDPQAR